MSVEHSRLSTDAPSGLSVSDRNQLWCLHSCVLVLALLGGAFVVAGWIPPPTPNMPRQEVVEMFRSGDRIRIGALMLFLGGAFFIVPCAVFSTQMRRIEGPHHTLANVQLAAATVGVLGLVIPGALWLAICYRDDNADSIVVTLNDVAFFFLLGAVGSVVVQTLSVALCVLGSDGRVYPRWLGYASLWLALGQLPASLAPFFKTGPFAWNGVMTFWVAAADFFVWLIVMWICTARAIRTPEPAT